MSYKIYLQFIKFTIGTLQPELEKFNLRFLLAYSIFLNRKWQPAPKKKKFYLSILNNLNTPLCRL